MLKTKLRITGEYVDALPISEGHLAWQRGNWSTSVFGAESEKVTFGSLRRCVNTDRVQQAAP